MEIEEAIAYFKSQVLHKQ